MMELKARSGAEIYGLTFPENSYQLFESIWLQAGYAHYIGGRHETWQFFIDGLNQFYFQSGISERPEIALLTQFAERLEIPIHDLSEIDLAALPLSESQRPNALIYSFSKEQSDPIPEGYTGPPSICFTIQEQ